jgi:hypothetical protein
MLFNLDLSSEFTLKKYMLNFKIFCVHACKHEAFLEQHGSHLGKIKVYSVMKYKLHLFLMSSFIVLVCERMAAYEKM